MTRAGLNRFRPVLSANVSQKDWRNVANSGIIQATHKHTNRMLKRISSRASASGFRLFFRILPKLLRDKGTVASEPATRQATLLAPRRRQTRGALPDTFLPNRFASKSNRRRTSLRLLKIIPTVSFSTTLFHALRPVWPPTRAVSRSISEAIAVLFGDSSLCLLSIALPGFAIQAEHTTRGLRENKNGIMIFLMGSYSWLPPYPRYLDRANSIRSRRSWKSNGFVR